MDKVLTSYAMAYIELLTRQCPQLTCYRFEAVPDARAQPGRVARLHVLRVQERHRDETQRE